MTPGNAKKLSAISIHALLAESDMMVQFQTAFIQISIHALLAESDPGLLTPLLGRRYFYPRSPCGERPTNAATTANEALFLSTLSLRRAT